VAYHVQKIVPGRISPDPVEAQWGAGGVGVSRSNNGVADSAEEGRERLFVCRRFAGVDHSRTGFPVTFSPMWCARVFWKTQQSSSGVDVTCWLQDYWFYVT